MFYCFNHILPYRLRLKQTITYLPILNMYLACENNVTNCTIAGAIDTHLSRIKYELTIVLSKVRFFLLLIKH